MASYMSITNDITEVIDDSFYNLAFIRKERRYFPSVGSGSTLYFTKFEFDITGVEHPVLAFSCICACSYYRLTPKVVVVNVSAANQQNVPNAISKLNNTNNYVDIYLFGRPTDNTPNIGMKVWNGNGKLVFDANHRYMKPYSIYSEDTAYTPVAGGSRPFNNNKTISLPSGRKFAVYPLSRIYYIDAQYISNGWETFWMADIYSSACAIDGTTLYLTSGLVDKVEDESVNSLGVCRHQYGIVDVTGL